MRRPSAFFLKGIFSSFLSFSQFSFVIPRVFLKQTHVSLPNKTSYVLGRISSPVSDPYSLCSQVFRSSSPRIQGEERFPPGWHSHCKTCRAPGLAMMCSLKEPRRLASLLSLQGFAPGSMLHRLRWKAARPQVCALIKPSRIPCKAQRAPPPRILNYDRRVNQVESLLVLLLRSH